MSDSVSNSSSEDNIPIINVSSSPKLKPTNKTGKKKTRKDGSLGKIKIVDKEQDESSLLRKRSKSAIDLSAFTNLTVLSSDSDYRTLGPEQIRLLWEENIYWRNEANSWKKLTQHLYHCLHSISKVSHLPSEIESIISSADLKMENKTNQLTLGLHMKRWRIKSKPKRKEPVELVLLDNPSKDKKNKLKKAQANEMLKKLNQFFGDEQSVETLLDRLPPVDVITGIAGSAYANVFGPESIGLENEEIKKYKDIIAGISISTYPILTIPGDDGQKERLGTPNCDMYQCKLYKNRLIACVTDGCGWGQRSKNASVTANKTFVDYIEKQISNVTDIQSAALVLVKAIQEAHEKVIEGANNAWEVGTTTLCGGILLEIPQQNSFDAPYAFLCVNIGDCKAYHCSKYDSGDESLGSFGSKLGVNPSVDLSKSPWSIVDITSGNRASDVKIAGGHLGPKADSTELLPDLTNFSMHLTPCFKGDIILMVSDGVHDNLDPEALGVDPMGIGLNYDKWLDIPLQDRIALKDSYRTQLFYRHFQSVPSLSPLEIANWTQNWVTNITDKKRSYMEQNFGKEEPSDSKLYPGKMDHSTVLSFFVQ